MIHNIDGVMLRNEKAQMVLSLMAKIRGFHIIASLDHINAPLCKYESSDVTCWYCILLKAYSLEQCHQFVEIVANPNSVTCTKL